MWPLKLVKNRIIFQNLLHCTNKSNAPTLRFAGHSKWANIKHTKSLKDGQRAALFEKLARQLRLAIQEGGSDPALNTSLKSVMEEAIRKNMPMTTIQNTIKKSQQSKQQLNKYLLELRYRQKVFAVCVLFTDNFAGMKMDIAPILKKNGTTQVSVRHLFDEFGLVQASLDKANLAQNITLEERATEDAIECGAEEVEILNEDTGELEFISSPLELNAIRHRLEKKGYRIDNVEHVYAPKTTVQLSDDEQKAYEVFLHKLLDLPGVEDIYDNVQHKQAN